MKTMKVLVTKNTIKHRIGAIEKKIHDYNSVRIHIQIAAYAMQIKMAMLIANKIVRPKLKQKLAK